MCLVCAVGSCVAIAVISLVSVGFSCIYFPCVVLFVSESFIKCKGPEQLDTAPAINTTFRVKYNNKIPELSDGFETSSGFTTDCSEKPANDFDNAGVYMITNDPSNVSWAKKIGDHTSGSGKMMFVNGGNDPASVVYKKTVNVVAGKEYILSVFAGSLVVDANPRANLVFIIGNDQLGGINLNNKNNLEWIKFYSGVYRSTTTGTIDIIIRNNSTSPSGNDFVLDDITFYEIQNDDQRSIQSFAKFRTCKQCKEIAVCKSIHGGVRGRGSNCPTCSIRYHGRRSNNLVFF